MSTENLPAVQDQHATMSSLEIAQLTGKEHFHVLRDIRNMLEQLGNPDLDVHDMPGVSAVLQDNGKVERYDLDFELTLTLTTGYSIPQRRAIVGRWHQLEQGQVGGQELVTAFDQKLAALQQQAAAAHQQTIQQLVAMEERIQGYAATLAGQSLEQAAETKTKLELVHNEAQSAKSAVHASLKDQRNLYPGGLTDKQYAIIHHCEEYAKLIRQRVKQMVKDLDPEGRLGLEGTTMTATRPGQVKADPTYPVCLLDLAFLIVLAERTRTSTKDQMAELMSRKLHPNQKT